MIGRRQLPVSSPVTLGALIAATGAPPDAGPRLAAILSDRFGAHGVALTDSGTSALTLALRLAVRPGGTVAMPAYACVDLLTAAHGAGMKVRFYDVVPATLSPDLDSVRAAIARGAETIVVAHLYGYPADLPGVSAVAASSGAVVIEDAAQHAGGHLHGTRLGASGPLTVLSFGRGKGTTGGRGGALLAIDPLWAERVRGLSLGAAPRGWGDLARAGAQWLAGRPAVYGIPASIPALRLGETVFHEPHAPSALSTAAARLVTAALDRMDNDRIGRAATADRLRAALHGGHDLRVVTPIDGALSGELRVPVLDGAHRAGLPAHGVVRSYPRPLDREPAARGVVWPGEPASPGAREVCDTLWTLPTHAMVDEGDIMAIARWGAHGVS
jgi:dTDP-4-amino-4,6-dideoxygalactose transaminase